VRTEYFITMDTHCRTTDACVKTGRGKLVKRQRMPTTITDLMAFIQSIPQPRHVCFEEGPLAGWLYRNLRHEAKTMVVCDPRRNAYVGKDGDKDDPIDAEKLNDLFRAGLIRPVHQNDSGDRAAFKQLAGAYHQSVSRRIGEANRLIGLAKRWGLLWNTDLLLQADSKNFLKAKIAAAGAPQSVQAIVELWVDGVQQSARTEEALSKRLNQIAHSNELIKRLMKLPGYREIRATTLVAYLDTPWRFKSREALWKYCGIGLRREKSGDGPEYLKVEQQCNRTLRGVVIGAAQSAIDQMTKKEKASKNEDHLNQENHDETVNVFARRYARWIKQGISPRNARRSVARLMTTAAWAMWKNGTAFCPQWIDKESQG